MNAEEIFNKAVELVDPAEQGAYLDEACGGDEKLRAQVEALLKWHQEAGSFLEVPAVDPNVTLDTSASGEGPGAVIGRYKLLEKVGEGGMATVYMAEQKRPIRRRVALKIIKLGMDTKQVIGRFEAERQALAMMDHPNIAKVFDAGTTETGRPYFVMELVRGVPITEFCDSNHLNTQERLDLFISVCQAVQHAHQRGIIHRDIKPSNILVTLHDGEPVAKVIDFGIAKAVNQQLTEKTVFTRYSQMIGTPEYMSPEQAEMSGLDIDTRTDVFSLGVLLYELLTGTTPFDSAYLLSKGYGEMQRIIREEEPTRPSTKLSTLGETLMEIAKHRRTSPQLLCKLIRSDLDWIVMKTLEKDRSRRYESVSELAADVKRHLRNEPVLAGRPSVVYRVQKFVKRNRLLVASALVIAAVLVLATTVSLWQMIRANRAADELGRERDRAVKAERSARAAATEAHAAQETAAKERDHAQASERDARQNLYAADMKAAQQNIDDGNLGAAWRLLGAYEQLAKEEDLRGWEWRYLWKEAQGDCLQPLPGHEHWVTAVAFSPDGERLASGSVDESVIVRNREGQRQARLSTGGPVRSLSFSHDGMYLAAGTEVGKVQVWRTQDFEPVRQFTSPGVGSAYAAFSSSGPILAIAYGCGPVMLWGYAADNDVTWLRQSPADLPQDGDFGADDLPGSVLAFSPDGSHLATFSYGAGQYDVWDVKTSQRIASLEDFQGTPFSDWRQHVNFVPGTTTLLLGSHDDGVLLWDFDSGETTVPIDGAAATDITQAVFTSDGAVMATAGLDHAVSLWDVSGTSFHQRTRFLGHKSEVWSIALSSDDRRLATGGRDETVLTWSMELEETAKCIQKPLILCRPLLSDDGQLIALAGGEWMNFSTLFYDLKAARFLETEVNGYPLAFADGGTELFVIIGDHASLGFAKWNLAKSRASWKGDLRAVAGAPSSLPAVCESRKLVALGRSDGSVIVANYEKGTFEKVWPAHRDPVFVVEFSPDGNSILTADLNRNMSECSVIVWSCSDLDAIRRSYEIDAHRHSLRSAAFSSDGKILATGGIDSRILLWDADTGEFQQELVGQKRSVHGLVFSPDGKTLASTSHQTLRLWHVATGRELIKFDLESRLGFIAFDRKGDTLAATGGSDAYAPDELRIWHAPSFEEIMKSQVSENAH